MWDKLVTYDELDRRLKNAREVMINQNRMIGELQHQRDELLAACDKTLEFILHADFDFRNGNVCQGIDEGEHYGWQAVSQLKKQLEAAITNVKGESLDNPSTP